MNTNTATYPVSEALRAALAAALAIGLTACDVHEFPSEPGPVPSGVGIELRLQFDTEMPLHTTVDYTTRSRADEADVRYIINVYEAEDGSGRGPSRSPLSSVVVTRDDVSTLDTDIAIELPAGTYRAIVWADYVHPGSQDDRYYTTADFSAITIADALNHPGNTDWRDGFRGEASLDVSTPGTVVVPMKRPMAKFRFITTDLAEFMGRGDSDARGPAQVAPRPEDYTVVVRYTGYMPSTFNAFTDKPVDSRLGASFGALPRTLSADEAEMGYDYVFVNGSETSVQVALEVYSRADGSKIASTDAITVPLRRSRLTEVRGRFLTTQAQGGMGIHPGFDGSYDIEIK